MSVMPITDTGETALGTKEETFSEETSPSRGEQALARMNLSSNAQDVNELGGYKVMKQSNADSNMQPHGYASAFQKQSNRRKSRIKYSGYGEEFAIQKIKMGDSGTVSKKYKNLRRKRGDPGCFIDPHTPFMKKWDPYMTFLLLYTALVTPYEVGFLASPETWEERWADGLWVFNQIVNISFLIGKFEPQEQLLILIRNQLTLYLTFH